MDIEKHNLTEQQSNLFTATSHQYFKAKARTVSTIGLGGKAVHLDQVVLPGVDHMTSYTGVESSSSVSDLADTSLYISHVVARTPERNSPLDFDMTPPTDISKIGSFSPSSVCYMPKEPMKEYQSLDLNSHRRQSYGKRDLLQTPLRLYYTQSAKISDRSGSQSQMWHYNK